MAELIDKINEIKETFGSALQDAGTAQDVDAVKVQYLGKKGIITSLMKELKNFSSEEKKTLGPALNRLKQDSDSAITQRKQDLVKLNADVAAQKLKNFDVTAYKPVDFKGRLHPYTQFTEEVEDIFLSMGYEVLDGPELETDFYNFSALNIPENHPARDMYDTLWTDRPHYLMRTHTSPMQIRAMQTKGVPIAAIVPGRVYRHESIDASHEMMFMQCEGFFIDKNVNLSHLFATAQSFLKALFNKNELDIRIRPGYFPFVEPGFEIDMRCQFCEEGCSVCKQTTWMEVFPGGLIHPNVLRSAGIDPDVYSGFAFGFGLSRLAMLKYRIDDIRHFNSGKMQFLEQF